MCNLNSITTNQAAIIALFRVANRYVGKGPVQNEQVVFEVRTEIATICQQMADKNGEPLLEQQ
jgi:hypothetical protein